MNTLYAPWRSSYIKKEKVGKKEKEECPFCVAALSTQDAAHFVLSRNADVLVLLNKYPYNAGHLLIIPLVHCATLEGLSPKVRASMMEAATLWSEILKKELVCQGLNIGINLGVVSRGSIPDHLHMHVLPRWQGDTNFLATLADVKLISADLQTMYYMLVSKLSE